MRVYVFKLCVVSVCECGCVYLSIYRIVRQQSEGSYQKTQM